VERNQYIASKYERLKEVAHNIARGQDFAMDLLHECLASVMQNSKLEHLIAKDEFEFYVIKAMYRSVHFPKSTFFKQYIAYDRNKRELHNNYPELDTTWLGARLTNEQLDLLIQRLPKFERMVFLEYIFTDFSYDKLSKETGIPKDYLYTTIKTAKKRIQNAIC
jgi:DNA-directed RNA polymerase specialized sigma24 family protein